MRTKGDVEIGYRAAEEVERIAKTKQMRVSKMLKGFKIPYDSYYAWRDEGICPSSYSLQKLCFVGVDVVYILTGVRHAEKV